MWLNTGGGFNLLKNICPPNCNMWSKCELLGWNLSTEIRNQYHNLHMWRFFFSPRFLYGLPRLHVPPPAPLVDGPGRFAWNYYPIQIRSMGSSRRATNKSGHHGICLSIFKNMIKNEDTLLNRIQILILIGCCQHGSQFRISFWSDKLRQFHATFLRTLLTIPIMSQVW